MVLAILLLLYYHGFHLALVGPMRSPKQRMLLAAKKTPVNTLHEIEIRTSEIERATVEQYCPAAVVYLPQTATIRAAFAFVKQIAMKINISKFQHSVLIDYEFLIHFVSFSFTCVKLHKKDETRKGIEENKG